MNKLNKTRNYRFQSGIHELIMKYLVISKIIVFLYIGQTALSQPLVGKTSFTLAEAQDFALRNNPNVQNSRLDIEAARQRVWESTSQGLPQVSAAAGYTNNLRLMTTLIPAEFFGGEPGTFVPVQFGTQHNANANITANQLLFSGPYIVGLQAASTYKDLSMKNLAKSEADIKESIAVSYYSILMAEASRDAYKLILDNMINRLRETQALYETGFVEETDVDQLRIAVTSLKNELRTAEQWVEMSYKVLKFQMGYDINKLLEVSDNLDEIMTRVSREVLSQQFTVENHIEYRILNTQEKLALLNVRMRKFEYLPAVSAFLSHQQMAMRREFSVLDFNEKWYPSTMVGVNISVPIFSSGMKVARTSQAKVDLEKTKNAKSMLINSLEINVQQARYDFASAFDKYLNEKENIELARKVLDKTSIKFKNGMVTSLELTQASDQLIGVQTAYIGAMIELLNAKIKLDKALGNL